MSDWFEVALLRYRRLVATRGPAAVAVLLALALVALAGAGAAIASPPTMESTQEQTTPVVEVESHHSAVVTGNSTVYERGAVLTDRSFYLTGIAPNLTVNATAAPVDGSGSFDHRLVLVYRLQRNGEVHWSESHELAAASSSDGESTVSVTLDVPEVASRADRIRSEFGGVGVVSVAVRHELTYETGEASGSRTWTAPLQLKGSYYSMGGDLGGTVQETETTTVTRPVPGSTYRLSVGGRTLTVPRTGAGLLAVALGLLGAALVVARGARRDRDPDRLARQLERSRYDEWISDGEVEVGGVDTRVRAESLADLVDVAIDSGRRVVHDSARGCYVVVVEPGTVYYYAPDPGMSMAPGVIEPEPDEGRGDGTGNGAEQDAEDFVFPDDDG